MTTKRTASVSSFNFPTTFQDDKFTYVPRSTQEDMEVSCFRRVIKTQRKWKFTLRYTALSSATVNDIQLCFNVSYMILSYKECNCNEQVKYSREERVFFVSGEWCTEIRIIFLNPSLYLQEDTSPWSWRIRTAQVSYCFHICSYLLTVLINVFTVFGDSHSRETCHFVFVVFCFVCFRSRSHPVPHRGERV